MCVLLRIARARACTLPLPGLPCAGLPLQDTVQLAFLRSWHGKVSQKEGTAPDRGCACFGVHLQVRESLVLVSLVTDAPDLSLPWSLVTGWGTEAAKGLTAEVAFGRLSVLEPLIALLLSFAIGIFGALLLPGLVQGLASGFQLRNEMSSNPRMAGLTEVSFIPAKAK